MNAKLQFEMQEWERFWTMIQGSIAISRHVEFFRWLQSEVNPFLPHDVMVAVWGDFSTGRLNYDVASNVPDIRTQKIIDGCDVSSMMTDFYHRWREGGEQCYVLGDFNLLHMNKGRSNYCVDALTKMKSVVVHGIRDRRGSDDCLYVFFHKDACEVPNALMELLLPQIDSALRRVECLAPVAIDDAEVVTCKLLDEISSREHEIMNWVKFGKTNHEIGMILGISPNTVKNHLKRIFQKLDVSSRAQAVAKYEVSR